MLGGGGQFLTQLVWGLGCLKACAGSLVVRVRAQLVPGQGLACLVGMLCHLLQDCGFLMSAVCPLVVEAGPEARAGFLEGRVRAQGFWGWCLPPGGWS